MGNNKFEVLTNEEVDVVMGSVEVPIKGLTQLSTIEMVKHNKVIGWLLMGKIKKSGKLVRVGIAHNEIKKPLFFAEKKDAEKYIKLANIEAKKLK